MPSLKSALIWAVLLVPANGALHAQDLPLKHDLGGIPRLDCASAGSMPAPAAESRMQATELASLSDRALILGDLDRARAVLDRAIELDPRSGELAYRRARVLEDLGEDELAASEYCRAIAAGGGADAYGDARERMESLAPRPTRIPDSARAHAQRGLTAAQSGELDGALEAFDAAVDGAPDWADVAYNRGVVLGRLGRNTRSALELRRYLELSPSAPDAVEVSRRIGQLEVLDLAFSSTPSPLTALTLGAVIPGMGQFYTGRARGGFLVVALTAGTLAGGLLITEVDVLCQEAVGSGERCPDDAVVSRRNERPHLRSSFGLAAAVVAFGAAEAFMHARLRRNGRDPYGARLGGPSITSREGRVDLNLISFRFR